MWVRCRARPLSQVGRRPLPRRPRCPLLSVLFAKCLLSQSIHPLLLLPARIWMPSSPFGEAVVDAVSSSPSFAACSVVGLCPRLVVAGFDRLCFVTLVVDRLEDARVSRGLTDVYITPQQSRLRPFGFIADRSSRHRSRSCDMCLSSRLQSKVRFSLGGTVLPGTGRESGDLEGAGVRLLGPAATCGAGGALGVTTATASASASSGCDDAAQSEMPMFHSSFKRSSRFTTSVPATEVLSRIQTAIESGVNPLPTPVPGCTPRVCPWLCCWHGGTLRSSA